ncbi:ras-related protein Rab-24-like [Dreissena polymorpha]|uniref:Ras-related protein Rab-24 n=1 Tax=Dreissena polymorpha TaxID=45954 RepID=A0A9D3YW38_DREPO|nr:ras-related protein Rab-24-like [Dreissena polymorpha]XP_052250893.1 ras-related protein Rab-24-like [Dreissena polymorpha]KAH3707347.1 hypothetical protein DPMN_066749 [Dreissena polymorpha]
MSRIDAKVVLLGKNYVGKTCLVNRYIHQRFMPYQITIGAAFGSMKEMVDGKPLVLGIWDTAGHEAYESITRMYYRGAVACILCYDITDKSSFERARFWAGELTNTEPKCKIYLCGTKKDIVDDDQHKRQVELSMAQPLARDFGTELFETSSKTGENIDSLFKTIARDVVQQRTSDTKKHEERTSRDGFILDDKTRQRGCRLVACSLS